VAEEKQYQSLYRRYRPQRPQEVLGQEHVIRALTGAIESGRLAHAFLFCGPRGTGKTSTARILAKMVNCEKGSTSDPCGVCEQCTSIREGGHMDVREIDAASHGGVEDARELRERAPTAPAMGREKVYIIDEAQRLSPPAFDALLKLFEEPPPGVRFILATTEPHKMPATIIGRCQRFDFRRVSVEELTKHLLWVAGQEGLKLSEAAAEAIARYSEGSVRDALSVVDQAGLLGAGEISEDVLAALLGAPPLETQYQLADALAVGDARSLFATVNRLVQEGQDIRHVTTETLTHFRNLLIIQAAPDKQELIDVTPDEYERLRTQSSKFSAAELSRIIALLLAAQADMRWTTSPRLTLELALVRAGIPETDPQPHGLVSRIERLERLAGVDTTGIAQRAEADGATGTPRPSSSSPGDEGRSEPPRASPRSSEGQARARSEQPGAVATPPVTQTPIAAAGNLDVDAFRRSWPDVVHHLRDSRRMILATTLDVATPVAFDGETLELAFPPDRRFGVEKVEGKQDELRDALQELLGLRPRIKCVVRDSVVEILEEEPPASEDAAIDLIKDAFGEGVATEPEPGPAPGD